MWPEPGQIGDPSGLLTRALDAIADSAHELGALLAMADVDRLLAEAAAADDRAAASCRLGPLDGVPTVVKDNIDTADLVTTLGSGLYAERRPARDATVVEALRGGGAVIVAKANMTELACGTIGRNPHFGDVVNPAAPDRHPGGSSSGSAAAVAAGLVPVAVGTDTSCSIRYPAAACGVVGLKPTFGRVPTDGIGVCSTVLDHVGPVAASVSWAAAGLAAMQDGRWPDPFAALARPLPDLRVGVLGGPFRDRCRPDVIGRFEEAVELLAADRRLSVRPASCTVDLDAVDRSLTVLCAEMLDHNGPDVAAWPELVGANVAAWFDEYGRIGPADRRGALIHQTELRALTDELSTRFDVLVCPTMASVPGRLVDDAELDRMDRVGHCGLWSMTGQPSLTVPLPGPVPLGLLLTGRRGDDGLVLAVGHVLEAALAAGRR